MANLPLVALAVSGALYHLICDPALVRRLAGHHRWLLGAVTAVALGILLSDSNAQLRDLAPPHPFPAQVALLLCLPSLAAFMVEPRYVRWAIVLFAAVCAWNFFAMPIEALWGRKLTWHSHARLIPREAGPFSYQASGLASAAYFFPGVMLGLFYVVWGALYERRAFAERQLSRELLLLFPVLWLIPVLCVQSRSAFAGALGAALLLLCVASRSRKMVLGVVAGVLAVAGVALFWLLFAEGKSGSALRIAYLEFYLAKALELQWLATGRSFYLDTSMAPPGWQFLAHSHNDLVQVLHSWGLITLAAYVTFWASLFKLIYSRFLVNGEYWPMAALVAVLPGMQTDLGIHQYEKAAFLVVFTAFCVAFAESDRRPGKPIAGPS